MPATDSATYLDWTDTKECEFCGEKLPRRCIKVSFGGRTSAPMFYEPCQCEGARNQREEQQERERVAEQEREEAVRLAKIEKAGIPPRYRDAKHRYAQKMADKAYDGQGFYIFGPNGTYKTTLAMAAGLLLLDRERDVFAVPTYDLMDAMRSRKDEDRGVFERACSCDVLILDDFGKEASNTPYACERLFAIIDKRDKAMLPIIATSNFNLDEIAENITGAAVGVAIASRLAGSCIGVPLDGQDRRIHG